MKIVWYGAIAAQAARVQAAADEERLKFNFLREVVQENRLTRNRNYFTYNFFSQLEPLKVSFGLGCCCEV